jgi:hypothetical protein
MLGEKLKKPNLAGNNPQGVPRSERADNLPALARRATAQLLAVAPARGSAPVATTSAWLKFHGRTRHSLSMENSGQTKVLFCCAKCGAGYQAIQQWSPVRATGSFKCQVCRETLHSWAGRYDYFDWKAIDA